MYSITRRPWVSKRQFQIWAVLIEICNYFLSMYRKKQTPPSGGIVFFSKIRKYLYKIYVQLFWKYAISLRQKEAFPFVCHLFVCFVLLLYVPSQQLWSWWDGQFTYPHFFQGKLEQALCTYFRLLLTATLLEWFSGREENNWRNYVMINLRKSMGPDRDQTRDPWICSQTRIYCQTRYRLLLFAMVTRILYEEHPWIIPVKFKKPHLEGKFGTIINGQTDTCQS